MPASEISAAAEPPLSGSYPDLLRRGGSIAPPTDGVHEFEVPLINLSCLTSGTSRRRACVDAMVRALSEWGLFQVTGHGVSRTLLERLRAEQARLFGMPFETKAKAGLLNGSYRWGTPTATSLHHLSWSEAFHVPLATISACDFGDLTTLRGVMQEVADAMSRVAKTVAVALAGSLLQGYEAVAAAFPAGCDETTLVHKRPVVLGLKFLLSWL